MSISLITVHILYFRPDYNHLLQEFLWQLSDDVPDFPRVQVFLKYWQENIEAKISEINIMENNKREWKKINFEGYVN